ncbi:hypothetical protein PK28_05250 [Hymenobacter sp. DG25B]|jgi:ketosteroid isomerase-like protein|uniref:YybH family protein n=1 Tax=Hymenobacter sp. DG25B TaxID=1385664 RepID=UPI0005413442|nr:nuclear transport factor 2 family protein [Hymenobacter sp. DG25B]AIZ63241.1 hypothetical protein PK28_05250 [Hymenobacter sp. DG25B]
MKPYLLLMLATAALASSSCTKTEEKTDAANVQTLDQQFVGAWNSKNAMQLDTMMADDVHYLQGEAHYQGKSEVSNRWVRETINTISDLRLNPVSSGSDTQMAYEAGTFSVDVLPAAPGQPMGEGEGNFVLIWKKNAKGLWKLSYAQLEGLPVKAK